MERTDTGTGNGYTVWNRVATAASTLTISVSKAWAANVSVLSGEGQAYSRLVPFRAIWLILCYRNSTWTGIKIDKSNEGVSYRESSRL